jgi:hypothetical protein
MNPQNPYASPAATSSRPAPVPRILRTAGLTVCYFTGIISLVVGVFIAYTVFRDGASSLDDPAIWDAIAAITLYMGFGTAWLLGGVLFVRNQRVWGWTAIAMGVAVPIVLFSILGA